MTFLINDTYLTSNTNIGTSVNDKTLKVALQTVTITDVKYLLGKPLYELFETHVQDSTVLTSAQAEAFEQIQYYMALKVEFELMGNILTVSNKGVTQDEHVANMDVVKFKRQNIESKAAIVKTALLVYLNANKDKFPEFFPEPTTINKPNPAYSSGIAFDYEPKRYFM